MDAAKSFIPVQFLDIRCFVIQQKDNLNSLAKQKYLPTFIKQLNAPES